MPKIKYTLYDKNGEWTDVSASERDVLTLTFNEKLCGYVFIGKHNYRVEKGEAKISLSSFPDGEYIPKIESNQGVYELEGFIKNGTDISMLKTSEATLRRLLISLHKQEELVAIMQSEITDLKSRTEGHHIFEY